MNHGIIVVGASAGGVEALQAFVNGLPADFPAAVLVVLHIPPHSPSKLPTILSAAGAIHAEHAQDGATIMPTRIYVAPPDKHLLVEPGRLIVRRGPKENRFRPSIDALFRSAAYVFGARAIGVVLSGALDDGTSGLWSIKRLGGRAVIQEPRDAMYPEMPRNVMEYVTPDHIVPAAELGALLGRLVHQPAREANIDQNELRRLKQEIAIAADGGAFEKGIMEWGKMSQFTCPECHGALVQLREDAIIRFRCHTGHAFTASTLLAGITEAVEAKLWESMRAVEEQAMLLEHIAEHFRASGRDASANQFLDKARQARRHARVIHESLPEHEQLSADSATTNP